MKRRAFLGLLGGVGATATLGSVTQANAAGGDFPGYPDSFGVLHDTTFCIGCRRCEKACNTVNDLPAPDQAFDDLKVLDIRRRTSADVWTVVNKYEQPSGKPVFRKSQCMHCNEPACASACFVHAFSKNPDGSVTYDPTVCVGCRYCMVACPFNIPAYSYHSALNPLVSKCTMCHPRLQEGKVPGCVEGCPTGALVFGKRTDLVRMAWERITNNPGRYQKHLYGEHEMGGTAWLNLSAATFTSVGLREDLGTTAAAEYTKGILGAVPMVVGIWPVLLGGAYAITKRKEQVAAEEQRDAVRAAIQRTQEKADKALETALTKAEKEKEKLLADEVKKAREEGLAAGKAEAEAEALAKAEAEAAAKAEAEKTATSGTKAAPATAKAPRKGKADSSKKEGA